MIRRRRGVSPAARRNVVAVAIAIAFAVPLVVVAVAATRPPGTSVLQGADWLRAPAQLEGFRVAAGLIDLPTLFTNSLVVVALAVPVTVMLASLAGTAVALATGGARRVLVATAALVLVTPASVLWVPRVVLARRLGLADQVPTVASPALMATSATFVVLLALAAHRIPRSLIDAARLEGLSTWRTWWTIVVPLTRGPLVAVAVLAFAIRWADLVEPQLLLSSPDRRTLALGLAALQTVEISQFPVALSAAVVATIPPALVFAFGARWLLSDLEGRGFRR